ncbi:zinc finger CCCH domain-containing protein 68-like isoform X2 [Rhodamnia argentea]|uniref:Zinc finger CCCH domain-containing protein 68-like isoform X2 n=1 Tax=Rhodamnia argentea TaxID=178133 RepID=A0ABM3GUT8_9MYRT|nr:zinc finger CCCH domain-containing protein 68-like isoform X2 [Rhodamnia argentea]
MKSSRTKSSKRVSWASGDKLCQISDLNGAKFDAVPPGYGGSSPTKQSRERIRVPCIHWSCPPKFAVRSNWLVATGEESEEARAEDGRALRVLEEFYPQSIYIPTNPFVSSDVAREDYDDTLTPIIPIIGVEDTDTSKQENKTSIEEKQMKSSGVETISVGDVELSVEDAELAAAAAVMFFTVLVKNSEQGNKVDTDLLVKFLNDPQLFGKFLKNETQSPESKQAIPQISQSSTPLSLPESKQTTLSLPMSSPELPPAESKLIGSPEVLPSELKQMCAPNLLSNSEPSVTKSRLCHPPITLASPKHVIPVSEEKSSLAPPSSPNMSLLHSKKNQPLTSPASPKVVLPVSQHILPPIPPSSPEASQPVTKQICPSIPISIPKQLLTESKQETPIPLSSPELSLPQPKQTCPPSSVSSCELLLFEPKRITPPIGPSLKFLPPTPANAIFSVPNQMQPPFRAPQAWPVVVPLPGLGGVNAQSSTPPIQFAGPPLATSWAVPHRPTFTYKASRLPTPVPVPIMAAGRAHPMDVLPTALIPTSCTMPVRPTFAHEVSILPGPTPNPTMWAPTAPTAHPGSALLSPPIPPSSTTARPPFTYKVSTLPSPASVPTTEAVRPHNVKDANYYKDLVRKHGGEKPENLVHIAPNGVNQNQLQNLKMDQNLGPNEAMTLKNEKMICMFFNTAKGCRNGSNCSYLHEMPPQQGSDDPAGEQSAKRMKFGG